MKCAHMAQRVDRAGRFWCVDCGVYCGEGEWLELDEPMSPAAVEAMRDAWRSQMPERGDDRA